MRLDIGLPTLQEHNHLAIITTTITWVVMMYKTLNHQIAIPLPFP